MEKEHGLISRSAHFVTVMDPFHLCSSANAVLVVNIFIYFFLFAAVRIILHQLDCDEENWICLCN